MGAYKNAATISGSGMRFGLRGGRKEPKRDEIGKALWDLLENKNNGHVKWKAIGNLRNQRVRKQKAVDLGWE